MLKLEWSRGGANVQIVTSNMCAKHALRPRTLRPTTSRITR